MNAGQGIFTIVGGLLVVWAIVVSIAGLRDASGFPTRVGPVAAIGGALVVLTMAAAVLTAGEEGDEAGTTPEPTAGDPAAGRAIFVRQAQPTCASCHTLADAGAQGTVGPDLDELRPDAAQVTAIVEQGRGQMPGYAGRLDQRQIAAIAAYVEAATR